VRIFLAGAAGAVGRSLVPMLIEAGHDVVGTTRSAAKLEALASAGAEPVVMDGLDEGSVQRAVLDARPDVVIHQLTALSGSINTRKFDEEFALTNQLRTVGTDHLMAAARSAGVPRFLVQRGGCRSIPAGVRVSGEPVQSEGLWAREHPQSFALMPVCRLARVALLSRQCAGHAVAVLRHDAPKGRVRPRVGVQPGLGCVSELTVGQCHRIEALDNGLGDRVGP